MRANSRAFEGMAARLDAVRRSGIPFGFIFTLTQHNLDELDWVATFAHEQGARLLQIHPLEEVGRARQRLRGQQPDAVESTFAQLEAVRLRERFGDAMLVQVDIADGMRIRNQPDRVFATAPAAGDAPLAELLSPLVVGPTAPWCRSSTGSRGPTRSGTCTTPAFRSSPATGAVSGCRPSTVSAGRLWRSTTGGTGRGSSTGTSSSPRSPTPSRREAERLAA